MLLVKAFGLILLPFMVNTQSPDNDRIEPTPDYVIVFPDGTKLEETTYEPLGTSQNEGLESLAQTESSTYYSEINLETGIATELTTYKPVVQTNDTTPESAESDLLNKESNLSKHKYEHNDFVSGTEFTQTTYKPEAPSSKETPEEQEESSSDVPTQSTSSKPDERFVCEKANAFYALAGECDSFIECRNSISMKYICPDGLLYNPKSRWPQYPCVYPSEVACNNRTVTRRGKAVANEECPRLYGMFPTNKGDCGTYTVCQNGVANLMKCPNGLAFNPQSSTCDWPDNVPTCTPDVFHGFSCPEAPQQQYGGFEQIYTYSFKNSCKKYIACLNGKPRLLQCDPGLSFDQNSGRCINSRLVINCE